tara:strand:- start:1054 stop:1677 length:624 start_codon:yes stop_codon:yes gene_type:complete
MGLGISYTGYRTGFPFPVEKVTGADEAAAGVGSNTEYPVAMTIEHAWELYWNWRTINYDYSYDYDGNSYSNNFDYERLSDADFSDPTPIVASEDELIEPRGWGDSSQSEILQVYNQDISTIAREYDGSYYPYLKWDDDFNFSGTVLDFTKATHSADITMRDSTVYNFDVFNALSSPDPGGAVITLSLTCALFWGYGGDFNTSTGART